MANRQFNDSQALEREIKKLYSKIVYAPTAATATLDLTNDVTLTKVALNSLQNGHTTTLQVLAAAANPTDTVLAAWTGTAAATVITVTPNDGTNNPTTQAFGSLATTTPIVLTKTAAAKPGVTGNGCTLTLEVLPAAANAGNKVLVDVTGTAAAIVITVTPDDDPVDISTADLVTLINTGVHASVTLTDVGGLLNDQTATGGDAALLVEGGEGDHITATFAGGVNTPVSITTAELAELITTGVVAGKTVTVTDLLTLRALVTAVGGGAQLLADAGEGDGKVATFSGSTDFTLSTKVGIYSAALTATGTIRVSLEDRYAALKQVNPILIDATARNFDFQIKAYDVNPTTGYAYFDLYTLTNGTATALPVNSILLMEIVLKNTSVSN